MLSAHVSRVPRRAQNALHEEVTGTQRLPSTILLGLPLRGVLCSLGTEKVLDKLVALGNNRTDQGMCDFTAGASAEK